MRHYGQFANSTQKWTKIVTKPLAFGYLKSCIILYTISICREDLDFCLFHQRDLDLKENVLQIKKYIEKCDGSGMEKVGFVGY